MAGELYSEEKSSRNVNKMVTTSTTTGGFCYSDVSSSNPTIQAHLVNQIQVSGFESNPSEIFNLTSGMEMIGFSKNLPQQQEGTTHNSVMWKGASSSKTMNESTSSDFYLNKQDFTTGISDTSTRHDQNLIIGHHHQQHESTQTASWSDQNRLLVDDSSLRCVFPCEGNERPSQGLSLSLSSNNPSSIGLQSFELRHTTTPTTATTTSIHHHHDQSLPEEMRFLNPTSSRATNLQFQLRHSRYLVPAQELLNEFCSLGSKQSDVTKPKQSMKPKQWEDENGSSSSSRKNQSLYSLEFMELQKRKTKLLSMLEELDRRYRHYCDQMKAVVSSFEAVAGNGAATVYSALASKAMSRHFRCLRDGILSQIHATKKAMGEKDPVAPGTTKGETPRLRLLDQTLRQQRAFQQMNMMENHPWRPQRGLPERSVSVLRAWLFEHFLHPYPSDVDKHILARQTGLSRSQVSNWFINARVRLWKPMVEEMYLEELKEQDDNMASSDGVSNDLEDNNNNNRPNHQNISSTDQKPTADQLVRIDSECLSSIITTANNPDKNDTSRSNKAFQNHHHLHHHQNQNFGSYMELDFSSYNHQAGGGVSYGNDHSSSHQNFNGGSGGGVSLTLGLQQHGGSGVSLAFSPASQSSLFYSRDQIEDCQPVQYSLLDAEGQNLPYRNLMGAQLLHDLAG